MRYAFPRRTRAGFTLVELLVVMAILAILVSLVVAGVFKYIDLAAQTQTVNDIRQLQVALESFKAKYGVYPPSSIYLSNSQSDFTNNGQTASLSYLSAIWPRLNWGNPVDWSGGQGGIPAGGIILEGDQCLVFFLNGPGGVNGNGWSVNPTNPTLVGGPRVGPFFEFPLARLGTYPHPGTTQSTAVSAMFPSFFDPYATPSIGKGQPYAFFCSGRSAGGYSASCPSLGVSPYIQSNGRYYNNNTFQIISAGKNMLFGPGGVWPNSTPAYATQGAGVDDLSNFSGDLLGVF